jgi:ATP-binding cassette subfamily F protein uup
VPAAAQGGGRAAARPAKLSWKEQRELEGLPAQIEALEAEQKTLHERLASAELYSREPQQVPVLQARAEAIEELLMQCLERWEALAGRA